MARLQMGLSSGEVNCPLCKTVSNGLFPSTKVGYQQFLWLQGSEKENMQEYLLQFFSKALTERVDALRGKKHVSRYSIAQDLLSCYPGS